jgi:hypothetical protein
MVYGMRSKAQKASLSGAQKAHVAKTHNLPPPAPPAPPVLSEQLRNSKISADKYKKQYENNKRSCRDKIASRDRNLEQNKASLTEVTNTCTTALQSYATLKVDYDGLYKRLQAMCYSDIQKEEALSASRAELAQVQHALKMSESDLNLARERNVRLSSRVSELSQEVRKLRSQALRAEAKPAAPRLSRSQIFNVKEKGSVSLPFRVTVLKLVGLGIGTKHILPAIDSVAKLFNVVIKGSLSQASVRNIIHEGGVAAHLQIAQAMQNAPSELYSCTIENVTC